MAESGLSFKELHQGGGIGFSIGLDDGRREFNVLVDETSHLYTIEDHIPGLIFDQGKNRRVGLIYNSDRTLETIILGIDDVRLYIDQTRDDIIIKQQSTMGLSRCTQDRLKRFNVGIKVSQDGDLQVLDEETNQPVSIDKDNPPGCKIGSIKDDSGKRIWTLIIKDGVAYIIDNNFKTEPWCYRLDLKKFTDDELMPPIQELNQGIEAYANGERDPKTLLDQFGPMTSLVHKRMWVYSKKMILQELGEIGKDFI